MALLDSSMLRGLWQKPKSSSVGSLMKSASRLPRATPARVTMAMGGLKHPHSPNDPFLAKLAAAASTEMGKAQLAGAAGVSDGPPLLDILTNPVMMAAPAQVERSSGYNEHRPRRPPPDLPSLLLNSRIVYIGMPLVPAVTELVIAELLYLQYADPRQPIYVYINSTGTSRADGETVHHLLDYKYLILVYSIHRICEVVRIWGSCCIFSLARIAFTTGVFCIATV
ncbi:hypothetical protein M758_1G194200 [Ceratodon purpureus]|nr:hypothetical protein M758_1G194200 [Ceratodon purpureus]KAG0630654.1 hypothetical protein M758_1G194200 [Ceratodon purpureus]